MGGAGTRGHQHRGHHQGKKTDYKEEQDRTGKT